MDIPIQVRLLGYAELDGDPTRAHVVTILVAAVAAQLIASFLAERVSLRGSSPDEPYVHHFKSVKMPGVASSPILPESVSKVFRKLFRRTDTPVSR